jgi:plasmid maintenance system antidote protein VapI
VIVCARQGLTFKIEKAIRNGRCLTLIPSSSGAVRVFESSDFLSAEEAEALGRSIPKPTPGHVLERFIWEFECGSVKRFAAKVGYHPNRISALKSATRGISPRLFRRMAEAYNLSKKDREFWGKRLLCI